MSERHTLETIAATCQNRHPKKTPKWGKKWVANLVIPTKATQLATATAIEAGEPYGSALPSETQYCEHGWEHGLLPVTCTLTFFHLCTPCAFCYSSTRVIVLLGCILVAD